MRIIATAFQLPMKFFRFLIALCSIPILLAAETPVRVPLSEAQEKLRGELANKVQISEKKNAAACAEADGWLFFGAEFRLLSLGRFWGDEAPKVSRSHKPESAGMGATHVEVSAASSPSHAGREVAADGAHLQAREVMLWQDKSQK